MYYKPSELLVGVPPFVGTMKKAESEQAASLLVLVCLTEDKFRPVQPKEIGEAFRSAIDSGKEPWRSLARNPFFAPDFWQLVEDGYARWSQDAGGPLEFTARGLFALERYRRVGASDV